MHIHTSDTCRHRQIRSSQPIYMHVHGMVVCNQSYTHTQVHLMLACLSMRINKTKTKQAGQRKQLGSSEKQEWVCMRVVCVCEWCVHMYSCGVCMRVVCV